MRTLYSVLAILLASVLLLLVSCGDQPAYMNPYGEGVDLDSVTTKPFQSRVTTETTKFTGTTTTKATTLPPTMTTVILDSIPLGQKLCPDCNGIMQMCPICLGTDKIKAEDYNAELDIFVRKYHDCTNCSEITPGYMHCYTCDNKLYVPVN